VLPASYDGDTPLPLVINLHGYQESIEIHRLLSDLETAGAAQGMIVVDPQIDRDVPRWSALVGSEDLTFVTDVLDHVVAERCVDESRVYVAGMSNGAMMASAVACQLSDRIAAVATVAGIRDLEGCTFERPVPVIAFHGTADTFVDYEGGLGASVASLPTDDGGTLGTVVAGIDGPPVEEMAASWAGRNGCSPSRPTEERVAADVVVLRFDCPTGSEAELYRVEGGGHAWPGSAFGINIEDIVGPTTMSIDANELMLAFFADHPLRDAG